MKGAPIIRLEKVTKIYTLGATKVTALREVDLEVRRGEFISIQGPSGSGKSTLLNMIGCIDTPTSGRVYLDGKNVSKLKDRELTKLRLHHIGFIFQQFYLIPTLTALENVALPLREAKLSRRERAERATALLETVGLSARADHYPNQLSGGEQQRVAIARAIANEPRILLADEPTGEIDTATSRRIVNLLKRLNEDKGLTIVLVTHDPRVAREAHRIINIIDGRVVM